MTIKFPEIEQAILKAFDATVKYFKQEMTRQLETVKWQWDGTITIRRNGQAVGSPRDIVDTKKLRDSLFENRLAENFAELIYGTIYAALVHEGYTTSTGKRKPARPWIIEAVDESNLLQFFAEDRKSVV